MAIHLFLKNAEYRQPKQRLTRVSNHYQLSISGLIFTVSVHNIVLILKKESHLHNSYSNHLIII